MKKKILLGICGIGQGHSLRQKIVLEILLTKKCDIVIFAFGESLKFYRKHFKELKIIPVSVPWIHGGKLGINFSKTASEEVNNNPNFIKNNFGAMNEAIEYFGGHPDFVVSDYEPISAQLAYIFNIPLITIDQQSKYLAYDFHSIDNMSGIEEKQRLSLFFPRAEKRFACSFFRINGRAHDKFDINIIPSPIRDRIIDINQVRKSANLSEDDILVYFSPYGKFVQPLNEVLEIFALFPKKNFYIFSHEINTVSKRNKKIKNIYLRSYDDNSFGEILAKTKRAISTAGHNFLSEVMFLGIASYAVPLQTFEQHFNAHVVGKNNFGVKAANISFKKLNYFLNNTNYFIDNINKDKSILLKTTGRKEIEIIIDELLRKY
ncbi:MAG: glycosyltransferase family protein [Candidatus Jorgensenbacteria bacterium]